MSQIPAFLDRYEWSYEAVAPDVWRSTFADESEREYDVYVAQSDEWVHLAITPLTPRPQGTELESLAPYLLQLNQQMRLVRLAVDEDGDLGLLVDLPRPDLSFPTFATALDALTHYALTLGPELLQRIAGMRRQRSES